MSHHEQQSIGESVMEQIKNGEVSMRPRVYHVLLAILSFGTVMLAGLSIAYISSILFFWLRVQTADTMAWGARANLSELTASFPWWALVLSLVLLAASVFLIRRYGRLYKHKTSTLLLAIVSLSLLVGLGLSFLNIGSGHMPSQFNEQRGPGWRRLE